MTVTSNNGTNISNLTIHNKLLYSEFSILCSSFKLWTPVYYRTTKNIYDGNQGRNPLIQLQIQNVSLQSESVFSSISLLV